MATKLNSRFRVTTPGDTLASSGVLIHQFDGMEEPAEPWHPCESCTDARTRERSARVSTSMLFSGLQKRYHVLPIFSYDGGVVLSPAHTRLLCAYGVDGHIDDGDKVRDGCGASRCDPHNPHIQPNNCLCGFGNCNGGVTPWRPEHLGAMLRLQVENGQSYSFGSYTGYNELVVESATWLRNLPHSVEAMFHVDCTGSLEGKRNTAYSASRSCESARAKAVQAHASYLRAVGASVHSFPLLRLRPDDWREPFVYDCPA